LAARLKEYYNDKVIAELQKKFEIKNKFEVPKIEKVVVNMGVGEAKDNSKLLTTAVEEMGIITGQKAVITKARKSIAGFKIRAGVPIGCKVTLRNEIMYEFIDRLVNIALPRVRDFKGLSPKAFDVKGNYNLGIKEHIIFPEIDYDKVDKVHGMDIAIVISRNNIEHNRELLRMMGFPFKR
jgi:large subunit ribosomal protein L5